MLFASPQCGSCWNSREKWTDLCLVVLLRCGDVVACPDVASWLAGRGYFGDVACLCGFCFGIRLLVFGIVCVSQFSA